MANRKRTSWNESKAKVQPDIVPTEDKDPAPSLIPPGDTSYSRAESLTVEQELFCRYFTSESEFYGNGVQSYSLAYNVQINPFNYDAVKAHAARLLMSPKIIKRIQELLAEEGLNDANVDKHLTFLITQSVDFRSKLGAIKEYNKLKGRITEKLQLEAPIANISILPAKPKELPQHVNIDSTTDEGD